MIKVAMLTAIIILFAPILASADPLLEAQLIALDISGQLLPPEELTQQVMEDLAAIRAAYPEIADIHYMPHYAPDQMLVGLTQEAIAQFKQGQYHALDELNAQYGVIEIDTGLLSFIGVILLKFERIYNIPLLSDIYEQANAEGVRYAMPNYRIGGNNTINADPPHYIFERAWGDCTLGCIYHKYWHFKVENGQVSILPLTWYVNAVTGRDFNIGLTENVPLATIQRAIDSASDGGTIVVAPGTYTGSGNRDIDFRGKAITVRSVDPNDPTIVANTVVSCEGSVHTRRGGFEFVSNEGPASSLHGISIVGGYTSDGGAIRIYNSSPTITRCRFVNNSANFGGAIECSGEYPNLAKPIIDSCQFENNTAYFGGAICFGVECTPILTNCIFRNNYSRADGGAIDNYTAELTVVNCTFITNRASIDGGAIHADNSNDLCSLFVDCLFVGNSAVLRGGAAYTHNDFFLNCTFADNRALVKGGGILSSYNGQTVLNDCILWGNRGSDSTVESAQVAGETSDNGMPQLNYCCVEGWTGNLGGISNTGLNPCFAKVGNWDPNGTPNNMVDDFFVMGDYHLLVASPCINAGDPNYVPEPNGTDLDGRARVFDGRIDMGAYEFPNTSPAACIISGNQMLEARGPFGVKVTLDGSCSSDADSTQGTNDDINDFNWYRIDPADSNNEILLGSGQIIDCNLPLGTHKIALEVTDKAGASDSNEITVTIQDTTPPKFCLSVWPKILWPPNHKMVKVTPLWFVKDICDPSPRMSLVGITSDDKGMTKDDILITKNGSIYLRAEHSPKVRSRTYAITYKATDASGNSTTKTAAVFVPHDNRK